MSSPPQDEMSLVKRALVELREMRARLEEVEGRQTEPIALVGMACRFPGGVQTPEAFWTLLHEGRDAIVDIPPDRWDLADYFDEDPDAPGKMYTRHGGFLDEIDRFDARFFGITPREAERIDPQQRMLLEVAWEALERAGIAPHRLMGTNAGVFVGLSGGDFMQLQTKRGDPADIDAYLASGSSPAVASGRLSYTLGLVGPSMTIDTACSSSLAALHVACQSLRQGECRLALAGAASLILMPEINVTFSKARMMAPDGRCKTFDDAADGYVRGEGCGMVVLKRLSDAEADGDHVLAVIRGTAINQDGRSSGLTVPNGPSQSAVIRAALEQAGIGPDEVDYVEVHGTGTALGDPIEVGALGAVFADGRRVGRPLMLGSVKTNVGHLEAAAGMASLIKVVLAMQHGEVPPHLHLSRKNTRVDWDRLPFVVPTAPTAWPDNDGRRIAGVSSFGFSGTNAHVVVESAPVAAASARSADASSDEPRLHVLPLSARTDVALRELAARMADHLRAHPDLSLADVCATAATGRAHFAHRLALVAESLPEAARVLDQYAAGDTRGVATGMNAAATPPEIAFLFTGQGAQYVNMGRGLYDEDRLFRETLDLCDALLRPHLDRSILDVLFDRDGSGALLEQTAYAQPALFALEYALVERWRAWGIEPSIVMGHSLGEDVAACVAGVFSLEDGLALIAARGRLMQALPRTGEMHAVFADHDRVRSLLGAESDAVAIAAINAPDQVTISGRSAEIQTVLQRLAAESIRTRPVVASHAFHSSLMDPMLDQFEQVARTLRYNAPRLTLISNVTGTVATADQVVDAQYWRRHVREPVRFADGVRTAWEQGARVFVEIGPGSVLVGLGQRSLEPGAGAWVPSLRKGRDDARELLSALATIYAGGATVDWDRVHRDRPGRPVILPTYPFQRERHWVRLRQAAPPAASPVPWPRVVDATRRRSLEGPLDLRVDTFAAKWERLDALALAFITRAAVDLGLFRTAGERLTADQARGRAGIVDTYAGLVTRWFATLAASGRLRVDGDTFVGDAPLPDVDPQPLVAASRDLFADYPSVLEYIERCGARLADVLTGRESALETLFPGGSTALADALYSTSPLARYFNGMVLAAVEAVAAFATPERPLRILEIGSGTGGTSAGLLAALPPDRVRYAFTDVGPLFLSRARDRFSAVPFVSYHLLDIEKHPADQGFTAHAWDVVVAANVLHATRNLHETLEHVAWLLASSGMLVMYEATRHPAWFDVTTGLISGWQRFQDDLRTDVPLVSPEVWERAVRQHGFEELRAFPEPGTAASVLGQHVLIARGPVVEGARVRDEASLTHASGPAAGSERAEQPAPVADLPARLASLPAGERHEAAAGFVRDHVVAVLRLDPTQPPDGRQRLMELGIDSLMAVEFRNRLSTGLGTDAKLPATLIFDYPTIDAIAGFLLQTVLAIETGPAAAPDAIVTATDRAAATLEDLDDEQIEALLNKRLESL